MASDIDDEYVVRLLGATILPFGAGNDGVMAYHNVFIRRYANTLKEIAHLPQDTRVLELAANPYGMTAALAGEMFEHVELAGFGPLSSEPRVVGLDVRGRRLTLDERLFNVECDRWPYADESFDLVIACEMLEHLAMDPMHVFAEANRILTPGGHFFVSTPNASCFQNVIKMLTFTAASLAPHYRAPADLSGIYQRHNRELTPRALARLFHAGGFGEVKFHSVDNYPFASFETPAETVETLRAIFGTDLRGDTLNFVGAKQGGVVCRYPTDEDLYLATDYPASRPG